VVTGRGPARAQIRRRLSAVAGRAGAGRAAKFPVLVGIFAFDIESDFRLQ
jgi:hypothetical protein